MASESEVVVVQGGLPSKVVWQMELVVGLITLGLGIALAFHPSTSLNVICVFIGILLIVEGIVALMAGIMGGAKGQRGWVIGFGVISLIAGIVVVTVPSNSVNALATLLGIWFIVMGLLEIAGGFVLRSELKKASA